MKKALVLGLICTSFTMSSVLADCVTSATREKNAIEKAYKTGFLKPVQIFTALSGSVPLFLGFHAAHFLVLERHSDLTTLIALIDEAKLGEGSNLTELYQDLLSVRPELTKEELAKKLVSANENKLFCKSGTIAGRLLRNLIADGSLEAALASGVAIDPANFHKENL